MFSSCFKSHFAFKELGSEREGESVTPNCFEDWFSCGSPRRTLQQHPATAGDPVGQPAGAGEARPHRRRDVATHQERSRARGRAPPLQLPQGTAARPDLRQTSPVPVITPASALSRAQQERTRCQSHSRSSRFSAVWLLDADPQRFLGAHLSSQARGCPLRTQGPRARSRGLLPPHPEKLAPQLAALLEQLRTVHAVLPPAKISDLSSKSPSRWAGLNWPS